MNQIKAMPIKMDGIYGVLEAVEDAVTERGQYFVLSEKDLMELLDFKFRYESCQD